MNLLGAVLFSVLLMAGCEALETKDDLSTTEEMLNSSFYRLHEWGYRAYEHIPYGFSAIDGNLFAAVTDEAQYVTTLSETQRFNQGNWGIYFNPDERFSAYYNGIYAAHDFLEKSVNYREILAENRDTLGNAIDAYRRDVISAERLRAEAHVLKAYYYFELFKRYGGVPIIEQVYENQQEANLPRGTVDQVVELIVREIDGVKDQLVVDWSADNLAGYDGRLTRGAALAIKARALLYAASPQFNPSGDKTKWADAAEAAYDVIQMDRYALHDNYGALFLGETTTTSRETIWATRVGVNNNIERLNYPVGTLGGGTGICPSQNLVDAYERIGPDVAGDPYANLDPRFYATIVKNGDTWTGRTIEPYAGGADDPANPDTSPTGYYLRKFLVDGLNLTNNQTRLLSWISYRYAEVLLNFAEAMNEAYGSDDAHGYGMTAREAINAVRDRVDMPEVTAGDQTSMRAAIKHERRIELAFEDHRYWDLRRWDDAKTELNQPIHGVRVVALGENEFTYTTFEVSKRVFEAPKMNLYPIAQAEIVKSNGELEQNPNW